MARSASQRPDFTAPAPVAVVLRHVALVALFAAMLPFLASGCTAPLGLTKAIASTFGKDEKKERKKRDAKVTAALLGKEGHSKYVGDYVSIKGEGMMTLQGVGLVNGLAGTGEDPPASFYRKMLLDDMRRMKIDNPEQLLASPDTALVIVTAYLPPLVRKGDRIDVDISLPEGSETTSLVGGWLLPCRLSEFAYIDGGMREGKELARSSGPVILFSGESAAGASLKKGMIPGGAEYIGDDRNLKMSLRPDYVGAKMAKRIEDRISQRFHGYDKSGIKKKMAEAKTDSQIELVVHDKYRENYPRYLQVIRHMTLTETPVDRHMRMQRLRDHLMIDDHAERTALELEGMGVEGLPALKDGLQAPGLEARFRAAEALAYLGNSEGVPVLKEAADKEPAFRAYALAALATLTDGDAMIALRELMNHRSMETRYGAFRALSTVAPHDPTVAGVAYDQRFSLHVVESTTEPMIHLTRYKKSEIVLFNANQEFLTPLVVRAGNKFLVKSSADGTHIEISRIVAGEQTVKRKVSRQIAAVIHELAEMEASYPDILHMLVQCDQQHNLPGPIGIDALPQAGRVYHRVNENGEREEATIGGDGLAPNIFGTGKEDSPVDPPDFEPSADEDEDETKTAEKSPSDDKSEEANPKTVPSAAPMTPSASESPPPNEPPAAVETKGANPFSRPKKAVEELPPPPQDDVPSRNRFAPRLEETASAGGATP
jgi:hypothetical protein